MSEIESGEVPATSRRARAESFHPELVDLPASGDAPRKTEREREGLPPGYRMRADAHYVDQLTSRRVERADRAHGRDADGDLEPQADGLDARRRRLEHALAQVASDLASIGAAASALTSDASAMSRRVNLDLIRAQSAKSAWVLKASGLIDHGQRPSIRPRSLGALLGQVRNTLAAELRLSRVTLEITTADWNAAVAVDEQVFLTGVTGAILATLGFADEGDGATIHLTATARTATVEVTQDIVMIPPAMAGRFFEAGWLDRPGGWLADLGAAAARAATEHHGGAATFLTSDEQGSTTRLTFARAAGD